jgi:hypothetical protein
MCWFDEEAVRGAAGVDADDEPPAPANVTTRIVAAKITSKR